jgi:hypothetical protein
MKKIILSLIFGIYCSVALCQTERDGILDRIEKNQRENLTLSRGLLPSLNGFSDRLSSLENSIQKLDLKPLSAANLNLLPGIAQRLDNMQDRFEDWISELDNEAWTEESLGGLFDGRIGPLNSTIGRLNGLIDELRKNRQEDSELTRRELEGIRDRLANLSLVPNLVSEAQETRGRILNMLQEFREARIEQQKEFEQWRLRFRPFDWLFSWINKIIANIIWVIGGLILILIALAGVRLALAKLFPEVYTAISKAVKFLLFIP